MTDKKHDVNFRDAVNALSKLKELTTMVLGEEKTEKLFTETLEKTLKKMSTEGETTRSHLAELQMIVKEDDDIAQTQAHKLAKWIEDDKPRSKRAIVDTVDEFMKLHPECRVYVKLGSITWNDEWHPEKYEETLKRKESEALEAVSPVQESQDFMEFARPLINWLGNNADPHTIIQVDQFSATLFSAKTRKIDSEAILN